MGEARIRPWFVNRTIQAMGNLVLSGLAMPTACSACMVTLIYNQLQIKVYSGEWYSVALPWKDGCDQLPDNLQLCHQHLDGLMKKLRHNPNLLERYGAVIKEQLQIGIMELHS